MSIESVVNLSPYTLLPQDNVVVYGFVNMAKEGWTKELIDDFVKQDSSLRGSNKAFSHMEGKLLEMVQHKQREIGLGVYDSMRVYFEVMTNYIKRCKEEKTGLWGTEMRNRMLAESSKDCYGILDQNEWKNEEVVDEDEELD